MRITRRIAVVLVAALVVAATGWAQGGGGSRGGGRGGQRGGEQRGGDQRGGDQRGQRGGDQRGGRGGFDPARMEQMMMDRMKERMGASDEEWQAIGPLVKDVMTKRREAAGGMFGGRGRGRGRGGEQEEQATPETPLEALRKAVEAEGTPSEEIKEKLAAYRVYRKEKEADLKAARDKLRAVLTVKQEAGLVLIGMLG